MFLQPTAVHDSIDAFEKGLDANDDAIPPSMVYAYAAIKSGIPYANGAPNLSADVPALLDLADQNGVPITGKDFKTGQTLMKTILAPGFKARLLDPRVVFDQHPRQSRRRGAGRSGILQDQGGIEARGSRLYPPTGAVPGLYGDISHVVRINYYSPRGDNKEGWDNIDIFGWLGYLMQIKINFLCRDSILAAPIVLDLALFLDLAARAGMSGIQEWLSFYWKSPMTAPNLYPEHDLFIQLMKLKNTLRHLMGEEQITHLGWNTTPTEPIADGGDSSLRSSFRPARTLCASVAPRRASTALTLLIGLVSVLAPAMAQTPLEGGVPSVPADRYERQPGLDVLHYEIGSRSCRRGTGWRPHGSAVPDGHGGLEEMRLDLGAAMIVDSVSVDGAPAGSHAKAIGS